MMKNSDNQEHLEVDLLKKFFQSRLPGDFEPLMKTVIGKVYRVIYRIVLNKEDAEDLLQETMIKAYEKIDTFQGKAKFSTWVCQIGVNMALTSLRKIKYKHSDHEEENLESSPLDAPDLIIESTEEMEKIHRAISELSIKLRSVITLSVIEEMDIQEIAYVLKCPEATVYWRLHQARKILSQKLEVRVDE